MIHRFNNQIAKLITIIFIIYIALVMHHTITIGNQFKIIHALAYMPHGQRITFIHISPQCTTNEGVTIMFPCFFFKQVNVWQIGQFCLQSFIGLSKIIIIMLMVAHHIHNMRKLKCTPFKEFFN